MNNVKAMAAQGKYHIPQLRQAYGLPSSTFQDNLRSFHRNIYRRMPLTDSKTQIVFIPALLCDEALYAPVIERLGDKFEAHVKISPKPSLTESVTDIL